MNVETLSIEYSSCKSWTFEPSSLNNQRSSIEQWAADYWTVMKNFLKKRTAKSLKTHANFSLPTTYNNCTKNSYFLRPKSFFLRKMPKIGKINTFFQQDEVDYSALSPHPLSAISSRAKKIYVQFTDCASENNKNVRVDLAGQMIIRIFARKKKYHWRKWF